MVFLRWQAKSIWRIHITKWNPCDTWTRAKVLTPFTLERINRGLKSPDVPFIWWPPIYNTRLYRTPENSDHSDEPPPARKTAFIFFHRDISEKYQKRWNFDFHSSRTRNHHQQLLTRVEIPSFDFFCVSPDATHVLFIPSNRSLSKVSFNGSPNGAVYFSLLFFIGKTFSHSIFDLFCGLTHMCFCHQSSLYSIEFKSSILLCPRFSAVL